MEINGIVREIAQERFLRRMQTDKLADEFNMADFLQEINVVFEAIGSISVDEFKMTLRAANKFRKLDEFCEFIDATPTA